MKARQKIDKILDFVAKKIQDEVSALIGAALTLAQSENLFISKEDLFEQTLGKQVVAKMDITGSVEGSGCLMVGVKDAIRLGGTLIMLPPAELDQAVAEEEYNEETKDSFGEIANIISGSYTKIFEEMYPEPCRFIRKDQLVVVPRKVDIPSEEPIPDQLYYRTSSAMRLDDLEMGELIILIPAAAFGLQPDTESESVKEEAAAPAGTVDKKPKDEPIAEMEDREEEPATQARPEEAAAPVVDIEKQRKRVDSLLEGCQVKVQEEISALLGVEVTLSDLQNRPITKEDFFIDEVSGKQVLAHIDVVGDAEDKSFLVVGLKDAIRIGGILIMLPPAELETSVAEDEFTEDAADAYGEIANIIAGVYTGFFEEQYVKSLRFIRKEMEQVVPLKVDVSSEEPCPNQTYYLSTSRLQIEEKSLGNIHMLFPISLLDLDALLEMEEPAPQETAKKSVSAKREASVSSASASGGDQGEDRKKGGVDILLISDDPKEAAKISFVLESEGYSLKNLSFKDNFPNHISSQLRAVFLVMHEVGEQAFGVAIKISSACSVPLIAAGPAWTRSKVIKAVKYGVGDILLTPASEQDIKEKVENNLVRMAA